MKSRSSKNYNKTDRTQPSLQLLTSAALLLPGLLQSGLAQAADDDEVDFGYSHYQEGSRQGNSLFMPNANTGVYHHYALPKAAPIEVDSLYGHSRITLSDRIKLSFNATQDTWAGATPYGSAPENSHAYGSHHDIATGANGDRIISLATPYAQGGSTKMDDHGHFYTPNSYDPATGKATYTRDRMAHVMGYASPETRKQGDFNLGYEWDDDTQLSLGGGLSDERDYQSRFGNVGGQWGFNQKRTTLSFNQSYTHSDIQVTDLSNHPVRHPLATDLTMPDGHIMPALFASRQDWSSQLGLTQVVNKDALLSLGMGFSRNTGFLSNPYKISWIGAWSPDEALQDGLHSVTGFGFYERRPDARNLWNWHAGWTQYVAPLDAALHFNYQFSHDDWAIDAHTFDADWVQPLGGGWTLTPRVRYYSQSAASFYQPYFVVKGHGDPSNPKAIHGIVYDNLPASFSSDQRLSGYGAVSGGLVLAKQFTKGVTLETGFEYYSHQGGLKLGGGGEQAFADYDFWQANANLKLNLGAMGRGLFDAADSHARHAEHDNLPAGLMFAHTLDRAGDFMAGYRYQHSRQAGDWLHGDRRLTAVQASDNGCPDYRYDDTGSFMFNGVCTYQHNDMTQSMHMLELMYAVSDRLTLMAMPQFMDMQMQMGGTQRVPLMDMTTDVGGIGDTGAYALLTLFDTPQHHLHASIGGTAPTGDIAQHFDHITGATTKNDTSTRLMEYGMQLGSGTWDFKPSLSYSGKHEQWNWGAQMVGTKRLAAANASGYRQGDMFETSVWGGYGWNNWLSNTLRLAYTWQDQIHGRYPRNTTADPLYDAACNKADFTYVDNYDPDTGEPIGDPVLHQADYNACLADIRLQKKADDASYRPSAMDYPRNYGGHYLDLGLGVAVTIPNGSFAGHKLAFEWQQPLYTNVNGYQLDRDHFLTFTWSVGF